MIRQIVGRCHVGDSYLSVIRYVINRMAEGYRTFHAQPKAWRKELLREIVTVHRENRELYRAVMTGRF